MLVCELLTEKYNPGKDKVIYGAMEEGLFQGIEG